MVNGKSIIFDNYGAKTEWKTGENGWEPKIVSAQIGI